MWKVMFSCSDWKDEENGLTEAEARRRYEAYCRQLPRRGGKPAKVITLYDNQGKYVAGFAAGGNYGKVQ